MYGGQAYAHGVFREGVGGVEEEEEGGGVGSAGEGGAGAGAGGEVCWWESEPGRWGE